MAYCKIHLYAELLESDLPEDPYLAHDLERYFPPPLPERYSEQMRGHRLRREIIATVVANQLVDRGGHDVRVPARRGDRRAAVDPRAGVRGRARDLRHALVLGRGRGARQPGRGPHAARDADRGPPAGRARRPAGSCARNPDAMDIEARSALRAGGADAGGRAADVLEGGDRGRSRPCGDELEEAGVPDALGVRVAGMPSMLVDVRHRRGGHGDAARRGRDGDLLRARRRGSSSTGCATGSSSCRARTAGRRWLGRRCATTCSACTARSRRRCSRPAARRRTATSGDRRVVGAQPGTRSSAAWDARRHPARRAPTT